MAKTEEGTKIDFLGGNNEARIGGNSLLIEHTEEGEGVKRVMIDCGALFPPEWTGLDSVIPDVRPWDIKPSLQKKQLMPCLFLTATKIISVDWCI